MADAKLANRDAAEAAACMKEVNRRAEELSAPAPPTESIQNSPANSTADALDGPPIGSQVWEANGQPIDQRRQQEGIPTRVSRKENTPACGDYLVDLAGRQGVVPGAEQGHWANDALGEVHFLGPTTNTLPRSAECA